MTRSLLVLCAALAIGCGDADRSPDATDGDTAASATASDVSADATPADAMPADGEVADGASATRSAAETAGPTTEQCRTVVGPEVTQEPMRLVPEQTFAITSPMHGGGCFVTAYDPVSLDDSERIMVTDGTQDGVYPYDYTVTDATGSASTTLAADGVEILPDHHLRPIAVSFPDLNADGTDDVVVVHDECHLALAWTVFADGWVHAPSLDGDYGLPACTVAEATAAYRGQLSEPVSP